MLQSCGSKSQQLSIRYIDDHFEIYCRFQAIFTSFDLSSGDLDLGQGQILLSSEMPQIDQSYGQI